MVEAPFFYFLLVRWMVRIISRRGGMTIDDLRGFVLARHGNLCGKPTHVENREACYQTRQLHRSGVLLSDLTAECTVWSPENFHS